MRLCLGAQINKQRRLKTPEGTQQIGEGLFRAHNPSLQAAGTECSPAATGSQTTAALRTQLRQSSQSEQNQNPSAFLHDGPTRPPGTSSVISSLSASFVKANAARMLLQGAEGNRTHRSSLQAGPKDLVRKTSPALLQVSEMPENVLQTVS